MHRLVSLVSEWGLLTLVSTGLFATVSCWRYAPTKDPHNSAFHEVAAEAYIQAWMDYDYATMIHLLPYDKAEEMRREIDDQAILEGGTGRQRFPVGYSRAARFSQRGYKFGFEFNIRYTNQREELIRECWQIVTWKNLAGEVRVDPVHVREGECDSEVDEMGFRKG